MKILGENSLFPREFTLMHQSKKMKIKISGGNSLFLKEFTLMHQLQTQQLLRQQSSQINDLLIAFGLLCNQCQKYHGVILPLFCHQNSYCHMFIMAYISPVQWVKQEKGHLQHLPKLQRQIWD